MFPLHPPHLFEPRLERIDLGQMRPTLFVCAPLERRGVRLGLLGVTPDAEGERVKGGAGRGYRHVLA